MRREEMHQLNFSIPEELWVELSECAKEDGRSVSKQVTMLIREYVKEKKNESGD